MGIQVLTISKSINTVLRNDKRVAESRGSSARHQMAPKLHSGYSEFKNSQDSAHGEPFTQASMQSSGARCCAVMTGRARRRCVCQNHGSDR